MTRTFSGLLSGLADWATAQAASSLIITDKQLKQAKTGRSIAVIWMRPAEFLYLTTSVGDDDWKYLINHNKVKPLEVYNQYSREGEIVHPPSLDIDLETSRVRSHEGRHRAGSILKSSAGRMPVAISLKDRSGYLYYDEPHIPGQYIPGPKRFLGFDDIPRIIWPQYNRKRPVRLGPAAFKDGLELWRGEVES